ncbi:hypothetical protein LTR49_027934 [Elasticomyces elasticus]|nr:hypothetical protein LTR49_027934 [Elasticomyces elasticus]
MDGPTLPIDLAGVSLCSCIPGTVMLVLRISWLGEVQRGLLEYCSALATTLAVVQALLLYFATHNDWGTQVNTQNPTVILHGQKLSTLSAAFLVNAQGLFKFTDVLVAWRIGYNDGSAFSYYISPLGALDLCWTVGSTIAIMLGCSSPWGIGSGDCRGQLQRWLGVVTSSICCDILASSAIASKIIPLNMSAGIKVQALLLGCSPVVSALLLGSLRLWKLYGRDPTAFVILTQIEQGLSILLREIRFSRTVKYLWETNYNNHEGTVSTSIAAGSGRTLTTTRPSPEEDEEPLSETSDWVIHRQTDLNLTYELTSFTHGMDAGVLD